MTTKIVEYFGLKAKKGEVGIELEVEGTSLPEAITGWQNIADGSLRGESCEYVLKQPIAREDVRKYLERVSKAYRNAGTQLQLSNRTSTHIHINVQSFGFVQLFNMITIYLTLEELLVKFCGETREGNLFCLRAKDAEYLTILLEQIVTTGDWQGLATNALRYAAMNVAAVPKFGSLEFRAMRGTDDMALIEDWTNILLCIRDAATKFESPVNVVETLSAEGEENFLNMVLGRYAERVQCKGMAEMIMEGVRNAQDLAYCVPWKDVADTKKKSKFRLGSVVVITDGPRNGKKGEIVEIDGDTFCIRFSNGNTWWSRKREITMWNPAMAPEPPRFRPMPDQYRGVDVAIEDIIRGPQAQDAERPVAAPVPQDALRPRRVRRATTNPFEEIQWNPVDIEDGGNF